MITIPAPVRSPKVWLLGLALAGGAVLASTVASTGVSGDALKAQDTGFKAWTSSHHGPSFTTLDDAKDVTFNQLLGINDGGRIAGYFGSGADAAHPNRGYTLRPPYTQQTYTDENVPGAAQTQVVGINNESVTVGFSVDAAGANFGFVRRHGVFTTVSDPNTSATAPFTQLLGVNDRGVAVGFYNDAAGTAHGFTYDIDDHSFRPVTLPVAAGAVTATGINNRGDVSGFYTSGTSSFGFELVDGHFRSLSFGAGTTTQALGINDSDQVVGSYVDAAGATHGFLWSHGLTTISDPQAAAGGTVVNGLNDRGQLVGFYVDAAGNTDGMLVTNAS